MIHMGNLMDAYNIKIQDVPELYRKLQQEFEFEPGKFSSLGIIYWGKGEALHGLPEACASILKSGIRDICALYASIRTPAKTKKFAAAHRIDDKLLRVLAHDIQLWLPQPAELKNIPLLAEYTGDIQKLESSGIHDQIAFLSHCRKRAERVRLSGKLKIPEEALTEYVRICDFFRMGGKMDAIRPVLYYKMGCNTFEKWASASPIDIIRRFAQYVRENCLEEKYLVPFPKEVGNGIAWAKMHLSVFAVEYP
jgi:hypothetical protein